MRCIVALALSVVLGSCASGPQGEGEPPYIARMKPVPEGQSRIYLLANIPARLTIRNDCVLFTALDGKLVLPVFERTVTAGRDGEGPWIHDAISDARFRDGDRIDAGGGSSGEGVADLRKRRVLIDHVPERCINAMTRDAAPVINPGMQHARP